MHAFTALATAAYCPRKLYYRRTRGDEEPPEEAAEAARRVREVAFRYPELLEPTSEMPPEVEATPTQFRTRLSCARERFDEETWDGLADPDARDVFLEGKEARGVAHKLFGDPPVPSMVFAGDPPDRGVWEPQGVRAVAAAKALARERRQPVERAFAEYPAHGVIREVRLTTRRKAAYRRAVRTVESMDGPPARVDSDGKCRACEYRATCGTRTRSLRSLLGL
jgi:CRISPR-associated exonuclease Cas4